MDDKKTQIAKTKVNAPASKVVIAKNKGTLARAAKAAKLATPKSISTIGAEDVNLAAVKRSVKPSSSQRYAGRIAAYNIKASVAEDVDLAAIKRSVSTPASVKLSGRLKAHQTRERFTPKSISTVGAEDADLAAIKRSVSTPASVKLSGRLKAHQTREAFTPKSMNAKVNAKDVDLAAIKRSVKTPASVKLSGRLEAHKTREAFIPKLATPADPAKMTATDLFPEATYARSSISAEDIGLQTGKLSTKQRAVRSAGSFAAKTGAKVAKTGAKGAKVAANITGKALISTAKSVTEPMWKPVAEFAAGHAKRKAAYAAADAASKSAVGLSAKAGARALKVAAGVKTAAATGLMGGRLAVGGAKMVGEGLAAATLWEIGKQGAQAEMASTAILSELKRRGAKQGLKVTSETPSIWRMATGGSPHIRVHDPSQEPGPDGKSLSQKRREQGEAKFQYNQLKRAAGRNVITGRSQRE